MPLDGRNFLELTLLAPGTVPAAQGSAGSVRGDFSFSVNGGREDFNSFLLDGADNVDPKLNTTGVRPPVDAIQEFEVLTSTPDAAHGRQAASQISVVMKSGTNQLQGTALHVHPERRARRDELFRAEGRARSRIPARAVGILDRRADRPRPHVLLRRLRRRRARTRESRASAPCPPTPPGMRSRRPYASGRPRDCGAVSEPEPLGAGRQLCGVSDAARSHRSLRRAQRHGVRRCVRSDGALQLRGSAAVRAVQRSRVFIAARLRQRRGAPRAEFRRERDAHPVAESAERIAHRRQSRLGERVSRRGESRSIAASGCPEPWANARDAGLSLITVSGYSPLGHEYNNPQSGTTNTIHIADTLTWTRGNHLVKAGFDGRLIRQDAFRDVQARGSLTFTGAFTGSPLVDLLSGLPTFTTLARVDNPQRLRTESYAWFVQDSYRVRPNVTLSAGLRYDLTSPPVDVEDRATLYDPQSGSAAPVGTGGPVARRLRRRSQQLGAAHRRRVDGRRRGDHGAAGRVRDSLQPLGARAKRRAVFQRAVLQLRRVLHVAAGPRHAERSVPAQLSDSDAESGVRPSARSADAVSARVQRHAAAAARRDARGGSGLRRIARAQSDCGERHQPAARRARRR